MWQDKYSSMCIEHAPLTYRDKNYATCPFLKIWVSLAAIVHGNLFNWFNHLFSCMLHGSPRVSTSSTSTLFVQLRRCKLHVHIEFCFIGLLPTWQNILCKWILNILYSKYFLADQSSWEVVYNIPTFPSWVLYTPLSTGPNTPHPSFSSPSSSNSRCTYAVVSVSAEKAGSVGSEEGWNGWVNSTSPGGGWNWRNGDHIMLCANCGSEYTN